MFNIQKVSNIEFDNCHCLVLSLKCHFFFWQWNEGNRLPWCKEFESRRKLFHITQWALHAVHIFTIWLYENWSNNNNGSLIRQLDCNQSLPKSGETVLILEIPESMCCVSENLFIITHNGGIFAYDFQSPRLAWNMLASESLIPRGVTTDGNGHLFAMLLIRIFKWYLLEGNIWDRSSKMELVFHGGSVGVNSFLLWSSCIRWTISGV